MSENVFTEETQKWIIYHFQCYDYFWRPAMNHWLVANMRTLERV